MQIGKISISCFQLSGNACNVNARMPVRSQGFFKVMMWYERCTGIVEVKGSNTVQAWFFFRLSFHNCKSCVYTCDDLPSYRTFVCHMHTPIPSPLTERIIAWWAKKKTCVGVVCDKICQKRFHRELSLMLGGHINPTKIPQFEHATCISENFLHGCYENSDLRHWKIQTPLGVSNTRTSRKPQTPEKLRSLGVLKTQTLQYFSNIATNYRLRATSLSVSHLQKRNFVLQKYLLSKSSHWEHFDKNQILLTVCNETLCWDRYVWRSFQIKRSDMLVIVKPVLVKKLPKKINK